MCDGVFSLYLYVCVTVFSLCVCVPVNSVCVVVYLACVYVWWCIQSGYYIPDVNVVRENYRAITPPVQDVSVFGFNIWMECSDYDTYKLVREGEPVGELTSAHLLYDIYTDNKNNKKA